MEFLHLNESQNIPDDPSNKLMDDTGTLISSRHENVWTNGHHRNRQSLAPTQIPGCRTFTYAQSIPTKCKRSKFNAHRRQEVATVRRLGACLRCRGLKMSV